MTNLQKTIAGTVMAATVATGIYLSTGENGETPEIMPIAMPLLIEFPALDLPAVAAAPALSIPAVGLPNVSVAQSEVGSLTAGSLSMPELSQSTVASPVLSASSVRTAPVDVALIDPEHVEFYRQVQQNFADRRSALAADPAMLKKWLSVYAEYGSHSAVPMVPLQPFRMIAEVRTPADGDKTVLNINLAKYKSLGYDAVLVTFDCAETPEALAALVRHIKNMHALKVFFAFSGKENVSATVFPDPEKYAAILTALAKEGDGCFLAWRRTSAHLFQQDAAYINYTAHTLRMANPSIPIIGELYYGNNHEHVVSRGWLRNDFSNSSAVMISSFGFARVNQDYLIKKVMEERFGIKNTVALVVGSRPYYLTRKPTGKSFEQNYEVKKRIEERFTAAGCLGVITMHDDGSDGMYKANITNNLSETRWEDLK